MNGADYIDFAAKIAAAYSNPAGCRSAISRAYYGAYHVAKSFLAEIGSRPPRNANTHTFVQHRLANCGHAAAAQVGRILTDLYRDRPFADYNLERKQVEDAGYAKSLVVMAAQIQRSIEACDHDEVRQEIRAGIADYERKLGGR